MGFLDVRALCFMNGPTLSEPLIHGDDVRFQAHQKTCDTLKINGLSGHDHHYRYPNSYNNAKRGKSVWPILPMIT